MERTEILDLMGELKLFGMRGAFDEVLTYGPGHYEIWDHWRRDRTVEPALRALVRLYEAKTGRGDASSSTGRVMCSSSMPIASS